MSFQRFEDQISTAADDGAQRALMSEIARWRAGQLSNVPALRDAAFAMSRLFVLLGDQESARREAHSLVSLCQTPPEARKAELNDARAWLQSLGGQAVVASRNTRNARRDEPRGRNAKRNGPSLGEIAGIVAAGRPADALAALDGRNGDRAELLATWARVRHIRSADAAGREQLLEALDARLGALFAGRRPKNERTKQAEDRPEPSESDSPLSKLIGAPIPHKLQARLRVVEAWAAENPDKADALAATTLRHHHAASGPRKPAPWLITFTARALGSGNSEQTREAIAHLNKQGSFAVSAYEEWPFLRIVELLTLAMGDDWDALSIRRGVLGRGGEPADRRMWTARLNDGFSERMLAVAQPTGSAYGPKLSRTLIERVLELAPNAVLLAPGGVNEDLRAIASEIGMPVLEDADAAQLIEAMKSAPALQVAARPDSKRKGRGNDSDKAEKGKAKADRPPRRDFKAELRDALSAQPPAVEAVTDAVRALKRAHFAFGDAEPVIESLQGEARESRVAMLLQAVASVADEGERLPRGTSLAVSTAASNPSGPVAALLREGSRYGGAGIGDVLDIATALTSAGCVLKRAFRGPTGRERKDSPVLEALGSGADGLWRLMLDRGDDRVEVWFLGADSPEARAAIPKLMEREARRVVVLPVDPDLLSWYGATGGPAAIGWTGDEAADVVAAL